VPETYDGWQAVLDANGNRAPHPHVRLSDGRLEASSVFVTLSVDPDARQPVEFADNLYGATAWAPAAPSSSAWQRADSAEMRLMIAPSLRPGQTTEIDLPLAGSPPAVRVLLAATWLDVSR
jgi:hypothetical protein